MNNIMDLIDFERRGEYVLADVKSATWFFECGDISLTQLNTRFNPSKSEFLWEVPLGCQTSKI
jgi:hypothetical protein